MSTAISKNNSRLITGVLIFLVIALAAFPLLTIKNSEFGGADGQAQDAIAEVAPNYKAWFKPLLVPPGSETESLLFALQAAIGSGVLFFGFGYLYGRKREREVKA